MQVLLEPTKKKGLQGCDANALVLILSIVAGGSRNSSKLSCRSQSRLDAPIPAYPGMPKAPPPVNSPPGRTKEPAPIVAPPNPRCVAFLLPKPTAEETFVGTGVDSYPAHPLWGQSASPQIHSALYLSGIPSSQLKNTIP